MPPETADDVGELLQQVQVPSGKALAGEEVHRQEVNPAGADGTPMTDLDAAPPRLIARKALAFSEAGVPGHCDADPRRGAASGGVQSRLQGEPPPAMGASRLREGAGVGARDVMLLDEQGISRRTA